MTTSNATLLFYASRERRTNMILNGIRTALEEMAGQEKWGQELTARLNLVLEELATNIVSYGGWEGRRNPEIFITIRPMQEEVIMTVTDDGNPFNPVEDAPPPPVPTKPTDLPPIGGLGIHLVKELTKAMHYRQVNGRNEVTVTADTNVDLPRG